ncbi:hypothetical protein ABIB57_000235 [Devosia sp. UYZn731]|uniref:hypothetical protein n=1 Tax=Devosia sp. UYZn731 TaxID=3156345 RepID=UPI003395E4D6
MSDASGVAKVAVRRRAIPDRALAAGRHLSEAVLGEHFHLNASSIPPDRDASVDIWHVLESYEGQRAASNTDGIAR